MSEVKTEAPRGNFSGLFRYAGSDILSGFLVFLIALPLCLGISMASGFPPIAGLFTAIIGGIVCTFISNSELTIKGPAAGLIVIALGCVEAFAGKPISQLTSAEAYQAYQMALAVGVAAGVLQILFGLLRTGILGEFFPTAAVHGMLAAIGIIIAAKQIHTVLGVRPEASEPLRQILEIPHSILAMNPEIAIIGLLSLMILFGMPLIRNRYVRMIPAPMVVLLAAIPLGMFFDLAHEHRYLVFGTEYSVDENLLVSLPANLLSGITHPDFSALGTGIGWKFVIMFALVGSLESMLSAKAIDLLDPCQRRTNLNRDMVAIGVGNTISACVGGLPMISEIVRSKANIDNGAKTRFADMYHALFLLSFVVLFPSLIHSIPLAALAAMLVFTGYRLAAPKEWAAVYRVGYDQLLVFTTTVIATLATDLLMGIAIGIAMQVAIHLFHYAPVRSLLMGDFTVEAMDVRAYLIHVRHAAVFSNWIALKRAIDRLPADADVIIDLTDTHLVDHTVMEKFHELEREFERQHRKLHVRGLDDHAGYSDHPHAARTKFGGKSSDNGATSNGHVVDVHNNGDLPAEQENLTA
jgi:MFS superfamily sulfate permease-like transporter